MNFIKTAFSGAQAAQAHLAGVAMNTANTLTPGYSRQKSLQSAIGSTNNLSAGKGVQLEGFQRISDDYLVRQEWSAMSDKSYYEAKSHYFDGIEKTIASDETSLSAGLDEFYNSLSSLSSAPDSMPPRVQFINDANSLAMRFNNINRAIENQKVMINNQREGIVNEVNTLLSGIAKDNHQIEKLIYSGGNVNEILDSRDQKIRELSQQLDINVIKTDRGYLNVSLKDGSPLVDGMGASILEVKMSGNRFDGLQLKYANSTFDTSSSCGSQLGGINDYQAGALQEIQDSTNNIAEQLAIAFNTQLQAGSDLTGTPGVNLFVFDRSNPTGVLKITSIRPEQLALATIGQPAGDNGNVTELLKSRHSGISALGSNSINDSSNMMVSNTAVKNRTNRINLNDKSANLAFSTQQRESVSGVDMNEEGKDLIGYQNLYQANVRVMNVGNKLFTDLLALF
ncbi:flagellar hook-associated protein FlgK [Yersinia alsatica]|uniref:flagellar hook-associated protein FlgK n=1 Tax=Yersinia alsatica TaxID=2890317 RepID=UPI0011AAB993|nr:flagellar hook-associated protein FlgK [Yersinia alsatica]